MKMLRSFLFVPADSPRKMAKARTVSPDAFIFDLEDGVAADRKVQARSLLRTELDTLPRSSATICVRINGYRSGLWKDDLAVAVHPKVTTINLPKCEDPGEIALVSQAITELEEKASIRRGSIHFHLAVETALGILRLQELVHACERVNGLGFGAEDFAADMGISRKYGQDEFLIPKSLVAMTAHAFHLDAIGGVYTNLVDVAGLVDDTKRDIQLGFTGKAVIHPNQIDPVHSAFHPSDQELSWAREVVEVFEAAQSKRAGVVLVRGKMVDEPVLLQAQRILSYFDACSQHEEDGQHGR
jgi:citrate lyase subunit beta/citryl-CoA lyase